MGCTRKEGDLIHAANRPAFPPRCVCAYYAILPLSRLIWLAIAPFPLFHRPRASTLFDIHPGHSSTPLPLLQRPVLLLSLTAGVAVTVAAVVGVVDAAAGSAGSVDQVWTAHSAEADAWPSSQQAMDDNRGILLPGLPEAPSGSTGSTRPAGSIGSEVQGTCESGCHRAGQRLMEVSGHRVAEYWGGEG